MSGVMPGALAHAAAAEVAARRREVLADGDVQRAAVGQPLDLLEDALAVRARADDLRPLAVLQRAGDDLRGRGRRPRRPARRPGSCPRSPRPRRCRRAPARARPLVDTTRPSGRNTDETVTASFSSPPPLWRRSSTTPLAPALSSFSNRGLDVLARARREAGEPDPGDLLAVGALDLGLHDRDVDLRALERQLAPARSSFRRTLGARRALDQRRRLVRRLARERLAVDADDHVARLQAALLRRRVVVDLLDAQAAA